MTKRRTQSEFWRRFFGGPSKELADVASATMGLHHAAALMRIRATQLSEKAQEVSNVAKMLRGTPGTNLP